MAGRVLGMGKGKGRVGEVNGQVGNGKIGGRVGVELVGAGVQAA